MIPPIVIIHYHLRPGGVTKVIENQVDALTSAGVDYVILTGEGYSGEKGLKQIVIPKLAYYEQSSNIEEEGAALYNDCLKAIYSRFGQSQVLWHIHNPHLGKNVIFPEFLECIAEKKEKILFLCHDFAEDGRATNYQLIKGAENVYPIAPNILYGFLNSRDQKLLIQAGIPEKYTRLLSIPIAPVQAKRDTYYHLHKTVLYPVRGIRRKNLGEFLLWAVLAPEDVTFALTRAPENPKWMPYYEVWETLAEELQLPVQLNCIGSKKNEDRSFQDWLSCATHCMTTSIAEGFGLTFLEPQALGIPLIGRDLPDITQDVKSNGVQLGKLYTRLLLPLSAIDADMLKSELNDGLEISYLSCGKEYLEEYLISAWEELTCDDKIDFGNLPEHYQVDLVTRVHSGEPIDFFVELENGVVESAYEWIKNALSYTPLIKSDNIDYYSLDSYKDRLVSSLVELSKTCCSSPNWLNKDNVLQSYLKPERFHFLRT